MARREFVTKGRTAMVTGGARGIGWAIAEALAEAGYHTVTLDNGANLDGTGPDERQAAAVTSRLAGRKLSGQGRMCDVTDTAAVREVVSDLTARLGGIDVLVNVAGILRPGPFLDDTRDTWEAVLAAHVGGHLNTITAVVPGMVERGYGRIVNVTSTAAFLGSRRQPAYSAAKETVVGLTRYLAVRLAPTGVSVNAIAPSAATRMGGGLSDPREADAATRSAELSDNDPRHVGTFVRWLVSDEASTVTGRIFLVTGNYLVEYEQLRPSKWAAITERDGSRQVAEPLRWVIGRPHPTIVGFWPTLDFGLRAVERDWEGTAAGIEPVRDGAESTAPARAAVALGAVDVASAIVLEQVGDIVRVEDWPDAGVPHGPSDPGAGHGVHRASGAVVFAPGAIAGRGERGERGADRLVTRAVAFGDVDVVPEPVELCSALADLLGLVQSAIRITARHQDRGVVVLLPGGFELPADRGELAPWLLRYGAVGVIRGGAATEAIYGARVNGLVCEPGCDALVGPVVRYLLAPESAWLNGEILTVDDQGVGLLAGEKPRWQTYSGGAGFALPAAFRRQIGADPA